MLMAAQEDCLGSTMAERKGSCITSQEHRSEGPAVAVEYSPEAGQTKGNVPLSPGVAENPFEAGHQGVFRHQVLSGLSPAGSVFMDPATCPALRGQGTGEEDMRLLPTWPVGRLSIRLTLKVCAPAGCL